MINFIFTVNVIVPDSLSCGKWEENPNSCVDNDLGPNVPNVKLIEDILIFQTDT